MAVSCYYLLVDPCTVSGPLTAPEILVNLQTGKISLETLAAAAGDSAWQPLRDLLGMIEEDAQTVAAPAEQWDERRQMEEMHIKAEIRTAPVLLALLREDGESVTGPPPVLLPDASGIMQQAEALRRQEAAISRKQLRKPADDRRQIREGSPLPRPAVSEPAEMSPPAGDTDQSPQQRLEA